MNMNVQVVTSTDSSISIPVMFGIDDNKGTLSGTLTAPIGSGEEIAVYDTVNGTTSKIGVASINGSSWTYTPTTALTDGVHSLKAMVQAVGDTTGVAGRVVSTSKVFTLDTSTPTQTTAITSVTDNVSTNGSVGNTTTAATIVNGASTDDTTPTLNGTISAALTGAQVIGIYDTFGGVNTKLANAFVFGTTWSYTPGTLTDGEHSFTAVVENYATGTSSSVSAAKVINVQTGLGITVSDHVGLLQGSISPTYRYVMLQLDRATSIVNWSISELTVMVAGLNVAIGKTVTVGPQGENTTWQSGRELVDGVTGTSYVSSTVNATTGWLQVDLGGYYAIDQILISQASFADSPARLAGTNVFTSANDMSMTSLIDLRTGVSGSVFWGASNTGESLVINNPVIVPTDDTMPTVNGMLSAMIGIGEEVAVYDTFNGVRVKLGVAHISGLNWNFTPSVALVNGLHNLQAMVQVQGDNNGLNGLVASGIQKINIDNSAPTQTVMILSVLDNVNTNGSIGNYTTAATVAAGTSSDDTTPTLSGSVSGTLTGAQVVAMYDTFAGVKTKLGNATVTGTTWSYTPSSLSAGSHSFTAVVENSTNGVQSVISEKYLVGIQAVEINKIIDTVGSIKGNLLEIAQPLTSARYIRIDQGGSGIFDISELQVSAWVNGQLTNVAQNKIVNSHYSAATNYPFSNLTDASFNTEFVSANAFSDNWIQVDLGANYNISNISVVSSSAGTNMKSLNGSMVSASKGDMSPYSFAQLAASPGVTSLSLGTANVGNNQLSWSKSFTSDESMPTLSGKFAAALGTNEVVGIWDGNLRMGSANVIGNSWSYSVGALSIGSHSLIAKIENASGQVLAATETYFYTMDATAATQGVLINTVTDSYGPTTGILTSGSLTDDRNLTLSGVVGVPTLTSNQMVAVYDGTSRLGYATMSGTGWSYTISPSELSYGTHSLVAQVENIATGTGATASSAFLVDIQQIALTGIADANGAFTGNVMSSALSYVDAAGTLYKTPSGTSTTDSVSPVLSGTLGHALDQTQVLAVYDGSTRLGNAVVVDKNWTYSTSNLSVGSHALAFQIESNTMSGTYLLKTASYALTVVSQNTDFSPTSSISLNGSNQILDLTQESGISWTNVLKSIDLTGLSGNTLLLKATDVLQKATVGGVETSGVYANNYQLMINGNATSKIDLTDGSGTSGWAMQSTQKSLSSAVYDVWVNDTNHATLYINHSITSVI
jgi:hypothetical protein